MRRTYIQTGEGSMCAISEAQMKLATNIGRENLASMLWKFSHSGKFRLRVTYLDLAQYAKV
jgi:ribosome biogenesis protein Nip4